MKFFTTVDDNDSSIDIRKYQHIRAVYLISYIQRGNGTDTAFHRTYYCVNIKLKQYTTNSELIESSRACLQSVLLKTGYHLVLWSLGFLCLIFCVSSDATINKRSKRPLNVRTDVSLVVMQMASWVASASAVCIGHESKIMEWPSKYRCDLEPNTSRAALLSGLPWDRKRRLQLEWWIHGAVVVATIAATDRRENRWNRCDDRVMYSLAYPVISVRAIAPTTTRKLESRIFSANQWLAFLISTAIVIAFSAPPSAEQVPAENYRHRLWIVRMASEIESGNAFDDQNKKIPVYTLCTGRQSCRGATSQLRRVELYVEC